MADNTVRFTVSLAINPNALDQFQKTALSMIELTRKEPGTIVYDWYLSGDRASCRLLEAYVDGPAVVKHLTGPVVRELVPKLLQSSKITGFEVYGDPGPEGSKILAELHAVVFKSWHTLK